MALILIGLLLTIIHDSIVSLSTSQKQIIRRIDEISLEKLTPVPVFVEGEFERMLKKLQQQKREKQ
ncbi:MAG: hypothetical protein WCH39_00380 [Schlesneria sp.]